MCRNGCELRNRCTSPAPISCGLGLSAALTSRLQEGQIAGTRPSSNMASKKPVKQPTVTPALAEAHGLKPDEYERIRALISRTPSFTEIGIFSAMWNEHCSYKSSKIHL